MSRKSAWKAAQGEIARRTLAGTSVTPGLKRTPMGLVVPDHVDTETQEAEPIKLVTNRATRRAMGMKGGKTKEKHVRMAPRGTQMIGRKDRARKQRKDEKRAANQPMRIMYADGSLLEGDDVDIGEPPERVGNDGASW